MTTSASQSLSLSPPERSKHEIALGKRCLEAAQVGQNPFLVWRLLISPKDGQSIPLDIPHISVHFQRKQRTHQYPTV